MIRIENLNKRFQRVQALDDISAQFIAGQVISLIGPNGSGKTTLIKSILGMVRPDSGKIYFDNQLIENQNAYRNRIGYMPQVGRYPDNMTIGQVIKMITNIRGSKQPVDDQLYKAFEIQKIEDKTMRTLSGGTRQKVSATLTFMFNPEVLILDEPTAGLDPIASEILKQKIITEKQAGKLILVTSHILSDLEEITDDIMYLQDGKVQFFEPMNVIKDITGETRLSKAIAILMKHGFKSLNGNRKSKMQA